MGSNLFGSGSSKGASKAENQIGNAQVDFMQTLQQDFGTAFAGQQNILNGLAKAATNILQAGPSQFGFSAPETTALNTMATTQGAVATRNAMTAAAQAAAATGGGSNLPTGAAGARQAQIAQQGAENISNNLLGIQEAGYEAGRKNYENAADTLVKTAGLENPAGIGSEANTAGNNAFNSAYNIQKQNQAASPWAQVGGLVGSLAGTALNAFMPGMGSLVEGGLGGLASKAGNSQANFNQTYQMPSAGVDPGIISNVPYQSLDLSNLGSGLYSPYSGSD